MSGLFIPAKIMSFPKTFAYKKCKRSGAFSSSRLAERFIPRSKGEYTLLTSVDFIPSTSIPLKKLMNPTKCWFGSLQCSIQRARLALLNDDPRDSPVDTRLFSDSLPRHPLSAVVHPSMWSNSRLSCIVPSAAMQLFVVLTALPSSVLNTSPSVPSNIIPSCSDGGRPLLRTPSPSIRFPAPIRYPLSRGIQICMFGIQCQYVSPL